MPRPIARRTQHDDRELAIRLRVLRETAGLTQEELAERAGLSPNAIGLLERGERRHPYPHTIAALADALGLSREDHDALLRLARRRPEADAAPGASGEGPPIPLASTVLIGRESELAAVERLLAEPSLVTITGPGGVGKTSLAAAVARSCEKRRPGGVVWVPLAALTEPSQVLPAVELAAERHIGTPSSRHGGLWRALSTRSLLVLDNFEHLLPAAACVAELRANSAHLAVLITSRAPLRLRGEREIPLAPLASPVLDHIPTGDEAAAAPAVRLFVERAQEVQPAFALSDSNAAAVAAICRRLDGLPLAIELAAARSRVLSPTALLARLDLALPLLTGGARDLPARQQTLRDTIAWSHDLLHPDEQALFRRLAVFVGGFTLDAAEAVSAALESAPREAGSRPSDASMVPLTSSGAMAGRSVLDLVESLVAKSLLRPDAVEASAPRFAMLETIREFAGEQLAASAEGEASRSAHARVFPPPAEEGEPHFPSPSPEPWLAALDREYDNIRAALEWLAASGEWTRALRLAGALWFYWFSRGTIGEGRRWLTRGLDSAGDVPGLRVKATIGAGLLAMAQADFEQATNLLERGESLAEAAGDQRGSGLARFGLGVVAQDQGQPENAERWFESALTAFCIVDDAVMTATTMTNLGLVVARRGDVDRGTALLESAVGRHEELGFAIGAALARRFLGQVVLRQGDLPRAARLFRDSLEVDWSHAQTWHVANALEGLAMVAVELGRSEQATGVFAAAAGLRTAAGVPIEPALHAEIDSILARLRTELGEVRFAELWNDGLERPLSTVIGEAQAIANG